MVFSVGKVGGKHVKISASQDNDTLYMGNICKLWTKERVSFEFIYCFSCARHDVSGLFMW